MNKHSPHRWESAGEPALGVQAAKMLECEKDGAFDEINTASRSLDMCVRAVYVEATLRGGTTTVRAILEVIRQSHSWFTEEATGFGGTSTMRKRVSPAQRAIWHMWVTPHGVWIPNVTLVPR